MPAWLATRPVVCRLTLPLRAACVAAALLFTAAVPEWALSPVALVDLGVATNFACGHIPAGGYLLVWQHLNQGLSVQRFTEAGERLGPVKNLVVGSPSLPLEPVLITSVVVGDSGGWGVFWTEAAVPDEVNVGGALFDAQDKLLQRMSFPDPIPDPGGLIVDYHPLAIALAGGGFFVASEVGTQDDPNGDALQPTRTDVYVMKLDAAGRMVGNAVRVNETSQGFQHLTGMGGSKDHVVVSWDSIAADFASAAVRARILDGNLTATGPEVHVAEAVPNGSGSLLAVGSDGGAVVVWPGKETGAGGGPSSLGVRIRAFGPTGEPRGAEHAANPSAPGDHFLSAVGLTSEGTVWVSWTTAIPAAGVNAAVISLRPFDLAADPTGDAEDVAATVFGGPSLTGGQGGALVAWRPTSSATVVEGFVVGNAGGGGSGPPSSPLPIESLELPGFRVWVRFSPPATAPSWATLVEPCLAQALCAAGLLPARAEVIVRLIGPKPNGFLWPQIVRFTTDQVEVWVQQKATGVTRYYLLSGDSPSSETLTGRVDRHGFKP
jgi:hypothetical protein